MGDEPRPNAAEPHVPASCPNCGGNKVIVVGLLLLACIFLYSQFGRSHVGPTAKSAVPWTEDYSAALVNLPEAPVFDRIAVPPTAALTTADKSDPVPPPLGGVLTGPPPTVSPGASKSQIQEVAFIVDAASSQLSAAAEAKLRDVAQELKADPTARLEATVMRHDAAERTRKGSFSISKG